MPDTDLTDTAEAVPAEPKASAAASRVLRAVERSRGASAAAPIAIPAAPAPAPSADPEPAPARANAGVDAREALRSFNELRASEAELPGVPFAKSAASVPRVEKPVREAAAKAPPPVSKQDKAPPGKNPNSAQEPVVAPQAYAPPEDRSRPAGVRHGDPAFEAPVLGTGPNPGDSFWANLPMVVKAGLAVLVIGLAAGFAFKFSGPSARAASSQAPKPGPTLAPMSGIGGWTSNWGDPAKMNGRAISLFRPSLQHADYRIEFEAQIESKAFGWVFRAKDPQNYYGYKVETVKSGLQPLVALARVMMVAGVESQKHYTLIEAPVRPDTVFRVRMDCLGSEFTTRVNGQLVEVWQDDRLRFGGVGLFSDPGERAQVRKVQIFETR